MTRPRLDEQAEELYSAIEQIAHDFRPDGESIDRMIRYELVLTALMYVMRKAERSSLEKTCLLLESFHGMLEDIREGRPSLADSFPKKSGQQMDLLSQIDLAVCCAVMTGLMRSGMPEAEAAMKVATEMTKRGLKFPPLRNTTTSKTDTTSEADKMKNWRDKMLSRRKGDQLHSVYDRHLKMIAGSDERQWQQNAMDLMDTVGRRGPQA